jgi:hydroxypyruvate isomerase
MIKSTAALGALAIGANLLAEETKDASPALKGHINHSACQWCYKDWDQETMCANAAKLGLVGIDLLSPDWFPTLKKHNLACTMTRSHSIPKGLNRKENWEECLGAIRAAIDANADAGFKNVICFSGNRKGMDDEEGLKNCTEALKQIMSQAEAKKVIVHMELLNSKRNHKDYMCDRSAWGVKLVKAVGSDNFKLLYDIYHMQIDEGDVIQTIKDNHEYFGHYHTGGIPGRHEIDESQELYYPAVMRAIVETGYKGIVAQEFVPTRDPFTSLKKAIDICDV